MKQFYTFENEQGDWTICYGEDQNDFDSQIICSVDDWSKETVQSLNGIVDGLHSLIEDRNKRIDALTLEVGYYKNQNKKLNESREPFVRDVQFDSPCPICGKYQLDCNCNSLS